MIYKSYLSYFLNSFYLGEIQFHQVISNFTKILSISPRVFRFHQESCALGEKFFTKSLTKWGGPTKLCSDDSIFQKQIQVITNRKWRKLQMNDTETETGRILETLPRELSREEPGK